MGVFGFLNRHRNKILVVGGAAGAVLVVRKILSSCEQQWQNSSSKKYVYDIRKKEIHFENLINECNQLCQRMSPKVIARLKELLDDTQAIEDLKTKRAENNVQNKVEIWKLLKVRILTRLLSEIYCTCILVCYMRVMMSVVGGQLFAKCVGSEAASMSSSELAHLKTYAKYRALLASFFDQRFDSLVQPVEEAVEESLRGYSVDYNICIQDFKVILDKIKRSISFYLSSPASGSRVFFLEPDSLSKVDLTTVYPDSGPLSGDDELMLRSMLAETQDILGSDDFKQVLENSIEVGYAVLLDFLLDAFIKMESKLDGKGENSNFSNPNAIQVPLVKILPQIRKRSEADQKALVEHLLCLDVLNCFAANVYDAFCMPK